MRHSRQSIESELRRRILTGQYPPGSRLPLRRELLRELGASPLTLQRAMDRLAELGFIHSSGTRGTFVAKRLPNRGAVGILFPGKPEANSSWNRFWMAMLRCSEGWQGSVSFKTYFLSDQHLDVLDHRRLCADLTDGGLMGLLAVSSLYYLRGSPVLESAIPRVIVGSDKNSRFGSTWIDFAEGDMHRESLRRLRHEGRQRVAFLTPPGVSSRPWLPLLKELGLTTRPEWWIGIPPHAAVTAQPVARLLGSSPSGYRPDALMILDDNLVPYATAGVLDAGLSPHHDITVAAHANFPLPTRSAFSCLRFGVDMNAVLEAGIEELERLARGERPRQRLVESVIHKVV